MNRITIILLFFSFYFSHQALGDDIIFSGEYKDIPFDRFIQDVERKKEAHFFYRQEWISGITITAKGDSLSLTGVLQSNLAGTGLNFYIDDKRNVFLTMETTMPVVIMEISMPVKNILKDKKQG